MIIQFELNDQLVQVETQPGTTLLEYLRSIELYSVKHGCDHGECGACTVLLNQKAVNACLLLMPTLEGKKVETLEKFSTHQHINSMQETFLKAGAVQCGFCTPGMLLSLEALDREKLDLNEDDVRDALNGNLCRCTGYVKPVEAALKALKENKGKEVQS